MDTRMRCGNCKKWMRILGTWRGICMQIEANKYNDAATIIDRSKGETHLNTKGDFCCNQFELLVPIKIRIDNTEFADEAKGIE